ASIIEFSKCVRRHHVTKLSGEPFQPFLARNGVTASVSPFCMSTTVPYWSKASALISRLRISGRSIAVSSSLGAGADLIGASQLAFDHIATGGECELWVGGSSAAAQE